jgi:hypothetical protein
LITALGGYYTSGSSLLTVDDEGIITNIVTPWCGTTTTTSTTTTTTTINDILAGSFTIYNGGGSISRTLTNLEIWGTGGYTEIGGNNTYNVAGNINNPGYAEFSIFAEGGSDIVTVNTDALSCTGASITILGSGTTTVTIRITPDNYNGSTDTLSGYIIVTTS